MSLISNCLSKAVRRYANFRSVNNIRRFSARTRDDSDLDEKEFNEKYAAYFHKMDIDGWEIRKGMNDLHGMDLVPDPVIINSCLRACRRVNDYALAIRYLEAVKVKCGDQLDKIWPYILQEIGPTLDELGIETPEQLGYDKPELALQCVYDPYYSKE